MAGGRGLLVLGTDGLLGILVGVGVLEFGVRICFWDCNFYLWGLCSLLLA